VVPYIMSVLLAMCYAQAQPCFLFSSFEVCYTHSCVYSWKDLLMDDMPMCLFGSEWMTKPSLPGDIRVSILLLKPGSVHNNIVVKT